MKPSRPLREKQNSSHQERQEKTPRSLKTKLKTQQPSRITLRTLREKQNSSR